MTHTEKEWTLQAVVAATLEESRLADPRALAAEVARRIPKERREEALRVALVAYLIETFDAQEARLIGLEPRSERGVP